MDLDSKLAMDMTTPKIDPTPKFTDRVENYAKFRPNYPKEVLQFLRERIDLRPDHRIADIGSGTGIFTEHFLQNGNTVYAVEPNDAMRSAAERTLGRYPNFIRVKGAANLASEIQSL